MIIAMLSFCIVAYEPPFAISDHRLDWAFRAAQEESIIGFMENGEFDDREVDARMPDEIAVCIRAMSCEDWRCREKASAKLRAIGEPAVPFLFWGLRSTDREVWLRCYGILTVLTICPSCKGGGEWCSTCNSRGRLWPLDLPRND